MDNTQQLLQISAKLLKHLTNIPKGEERSEFIDEINDMLDERGTIVEKLRQEGFQMDPTNKLHTTLVELDSGIRARLDDTMKLVKQDMKDLQQSKKHEKQYMNPYASVQVMDGMYYDKKK
ncbi:flagellar protein FliT [Ureibacillus sp. 179-F W5.1 NHS]|uniref:Flagellar protein FliT n=1 Tax=Lysinibacillus halotolerans TaxID=1368476 RepID=A0A3M8HEI5_9BACI|nr:flagellar protein FliT [Lysinibacillus halotolerans]RND00655.1 flagellar protein FliT [Lysinibacillus halotolerans]